MKQRHYEQLIVWQESHKLCLKVYQLVDQFPPKEQFGLCSQMRRSASSVPTNIVEGNVKRSAREKLHFIEHSEGSLEELDYQMFLSRDLCYITPEEFESLRGCISRVSYLLTKFRAGIT